MNPASEWLSARIADAPDQLRVRMLAAVADVAGQATVHDQLADAAQRCLQRALGKAGSRATALDLLAADALLTHACEAAAEAGDDVLLEFTRRWSPRRFDELLTTRAE